MMEKELFSGLVVGAFDRYPWLLVAIFFAILVYYGLKSSWQRAGKIVHQSNFRLLLRDYPFRRKLWMGLLSVLAMFLIAFSLLEPKWGFHWEDLRREGVDVIVAVDVSKSMLAEDLTPNRLERARRKIIDLLGILQGDRIGLIAFAGVGFVQCPLTLDYSAFRGFLDILEPDLIPQPGTAIDDAINEAVAAFEKSGSKSKALIIMSDGEDHSQSAIEAAKKAAENDIRIFTMGFGSPEGVPVPDPRRGNRHMTDRSGNIVLSRLNEELLQRIALESGGAYSRALNTDDDLLLIYEQEIRGRMELQELHSTRLKRYEHRFQWFLLAAFLLLCAETLIKRFSFSFSAGAIRGLVLFIFLYGFVSADALAEKFGAPGLREQKNRLGINAYKNGEYDQALSAFSDIEIDNPQDLENLFNMGGAYYKMGDYLRASDYFNRVLAATEDPQLREKVLYNMGNTTYRQGAYEQSINFYEQVLQLNPQNREAELNLEFVRQKLREHMKNQEQQDCDNCNNESGEKKAQGEKQEGKQNSGSEKQDGSESGAEQENQQQADKNAQDNRQQPQNGTEEQEQQDKDDKAAAENDEKTEADEKGSEMKAAEENLAEDKNAEAKESQNGAENPPANSESGRQMKEMPRLSPEEAQKFLNRLSKESMEHLKNSMIQRILQRGRTNQEKEW